MCPIVEMDIVVGIALDEMNALIFQRCAKVLECLFEQLRQEEQTGSLVESLTTVSLQLDIDTKGSIRSRHDVSDCIAHQRNHSSQQA